MSQAYSTGPAYVSISPGGTASFLGTPERSPDLEVRPQYEQVMNDLAGGKVPFDMMYVGMDAIVSFDLTVWNAEIWESAKAFWNPGLGDVGDDPEFARGTLMLTEEKAFDLWIGYPRSSMPAYSTLPAGYHFLSAFVQGPVKMNPGITPYKERAVFYCLAPYDGSRRGFQLYNHDMSGAAEPD